jgi:hypothetical protein
VVLFSTLAASLIGRPIRLTGCPSLSLGVLPRTRARASTTFIGTSIPVQEPIVALRSCPRRSEFHSRLRFR